MRSGTPHTSTPLSTSLACEMLKAGFIVSQIKNETYSGFFSFDDSLLTGSGNEYLAVSNLNLNFLDGDFLGLFYSVSSVDPSFVFNPGFSSVNADELALPKLLV